MNSVRAITEDLFYVGVDDRRLSLFENIHPISKGVSYNAYLLLDEKTVLFDTADWAVGREFIENVKSVLDGRPLDYLVINHMEPDHAACIEEVLLRWPSATVISNEKAFLIMRQFGFNVDSTKTIEVKEGDTQCFGKHTVTFVFAPMVHWPETMVTFDITNGVLFCADAFGSFGALNGHLFSDEMDFKTQWIDEARRYYTNIVGKYGPHVQSLLKKAGTVPIKILCPLHGPVWREDLGWFIEKYDKWSSYTPEEEGVLVIYASMYGNTESAVNALTQKLVEKGVTNLKAYDVSTTHVSELISETFKYSHIVLASPTYNLNVYPLMHNYLMDLKALNVQKRTVGIIENGSWACRSGAVMRECLGELKHMTILDEQVSIASSMHEGNLLEIDRLVDALIDSMSAKKA